MVTYFPKPLNKQVEAISDSLTRTQKGLGIGASGDTHDAIGSGQFVYVKDHSSLAEGLYKATAAIAQNGALSTSNLTADESGGLNDLQAQVTSLDIKVTSYTNITSGADLNSFTDTGHYACPTGAIAQTLTHCPISDAGFSMDVIKWASTVSAQYIIANNRMFFRRTQNDSWQEVALKSDINSIDSILSGERKAASFNGVSYYAYKIGKMIAICAYAGGATAAMSAGDTMITLSDFDSSWANYKFANYWQNSIASYPSVRYSAESNTNKITLVGGNITSGTSIRGELITFIQ